MVMETTVASDVVTTPILGVEATVEAPQGVPQSQPEVASPFPATTSQSGLQPPTPSVSPEIAVREIGLDYRQAMMQLQGEYSQRLTQLQEGYGLSVEQAQEVTNREFSVRQQTLDAQAEARLGSHVIQMIAAKHGVPASELAKLNNPYLMEAVAPTLRRAMALDAENKQLKLQLAKMGRGAGTSTQYTGGAQLGAAPMTRGALLDRYIKGETLSPNEMGVLYPNG